MKFKSLLLALPLMAGISMADDANIYHKLSGMPISESVEVTAGQNMIFLSGKVPTKIDPQSEDESLEAYGDTKTQTINVLNQIKQHLETLDLTMEDVVKMQVFLVGGEESGGTMDFKGFMEGYSQFYDEKVTEKLPARSAFQVAKLAHPAWRVEIEVTAVRPAK